MQKKKFFILFLSVVFTISFVLPVMAAKPKIASVVIQQSDSNIVVGATLQLAAKAYDKSGNEITTAKISWKSSKKKIASISKTGLVTGISSGQTIITASASGKKDTIIITVGASTTVAVTSVSLDKSVMNLTAGGDAGQLVPTILPANATDKTITWASDAPTVAAVTNNGLVTPLSAGIANITVTTNDGNKQAVCQVTVAAAAIVVESVTLNKSTLNLVAGGVQEQLTATVLPANATDKTVTWASDTPAVAAVGNNGLVTPVSAGTANITVTTHDGSKQAVCQVTVTAVALPFTLASTSFTNGGAIGRKYAYEHGNVSIELHWSGLPEGAKSIAILMYDPMADNCVHWEIINIPTSVNSLQEGASGVAMPAECQELSKYFGPCPPEMHIYHFVIYALNTERLTGFSGECDVASFNSRLSPYVIERAEITGSYTP